MQYKNGKAYKVDVSVVRELFGLMAAEGAAGGFMVSSGGRNIRLLDAEALFALIQSLRKTRSRPAGASLEVPRLLLICLLARCVWSRWRRGPPSGEVTRCGVLGCLGVRLVTE